jgi:2-keto-3-deoxy-6-phosphogluconate aldolase
MSAEIREQLLAQRIVPVLRLASAELTERADVVKVFPASTGGPEHVRALHAVFPDILLCPTGGVSQQNIEAYFAAGAALVGVGNNIVDQKAVQAGDGARAMEHARGFLHPGTAAG